MILVRFDLNAEWTRFRRQARRAQSPDQWLRSALWDMGGDVLEEARNIAQSISSRTARGLYRRVFQEERLWVVEIGSSWEGYPTSNQDGVGDAARAASEGWATLAYRQEFGYPDQSPAGTNFPGNPKPYNPAAGYTRARPFLTRTLARRESQVPHRLWVDAIKPIIASRGRPR